MSLIRQMHFGELQQQLAWAAREGWNPGVQDALPFWEADPDGFLAICDDENRVVGGGAIVRYSANFGFMGLFIVDQPHRGQGLGTQLWFHRRDHLLSRLDAGGTIGLDGVDAMVPFYEKGGFRSFTRHRRFQWVSPPMIEMKYDDIVPLVTISQEKVADYDEQCFPARREKFLKTWISQPDTISLGLWHEENLSGYGVIRRCQVGWKIGPLFADTPEFANRLFQSLHQACCGEPVIIDIPDSNPNAMALWQKYGMQEVFGCVRMYYGPPPQVDNTKIYGITTLEIG